jgi:hypothetical protein
MPAKSGPVLVDGAVGVEDVDGFEAEPPADLEVVRVVGRRYLEDAGPEVRVDVVVGVDLDLPPTNGTVTRRPMRFLYRPSSG